MSIKNKLFKVVASLCFSTSCSKETMSDKEIINNIVDNFYLIAKVPRPSHHEEKISNYLMEWATNHGLKPVQDNVYNVMFDVEATKGMENKSLGILQVHMDMVVAVRDGKEFDPLNDPIIVIRDDEKNTLTADGTSLGGDDGAGIAIVMSVVESKMAHGPLRIIVTVDEEDGMTGTFNLDKLWLDDAEFLINIDNEWSSEVLVSTAAGDTISASKTVNMIKPNGNKALNVSISNLKGGHSGVLIDKGRLNGLIGLANFLKNVDINYELASFSGGTASNAIPTKGIANIVINNKDKELFINKFNNYCDELKIKYNGIEEDIKCEVNELDDIPLVISKNEKDNAIKYLSEIIDGVYTMSKDMKDLVESSSNLGLFKIDNGLIEFTSLIRSSSPEKEEELINKELELAKECGYEAKTAKGSDAWPYDPNSKLVELAKSVYKKQNKEEIKVSAVHAGLECGTFKKLKPELDMISIGPDLVDGHTIKETLYLSSLPKVWHLLEGILKDYPNK